MSSKRRAAKRRLEQQQHEESLVGFVPVKSLPQFKGRINTPSGKSGYGFIDYASIAQVGGPKMALPREDMFIHVNENPDLPNPIPMDVWVTFFVKLAPSRRSGVEVFGAKLDAQQAGS